MTGSHRCFLIFFNGGGASPPIEKKQKKSVTACQANSISTSISISIFEHERRDLAETSPKPCRNSPKPRRNLAETSPKLRRICHFYFARECRISLEKNLIDNRISGEPQYHRYGQGYLQPGALSFLTADVATSWRRRRVVVATSSRRRRDVATTLIPLGGSN